MATVTVQWTNEDVYFQPLCTNRLFTQTPPNASDGAGCYVCITPIEVTPPPPP